MMKLDEIRKLIDAATPGPWCFRLTGSGHYEVVSGLAGHQPFRPDVDSKLTHLVVSAGMSDEEYRLGVEVNADAAFIAASRTLLPKLLAVAEAAEKIPMPLNLAAAEPEERALALALQALESAD